MAIPRAAILFTMVVSLCVSSAFAQQDQRTRVVTVDEGITLRVPPAWRLTPLKGPVKLELTRAEGGAIAMAVYVTVERRRGASDAVQRVAEIAGPPAPEDRLFVMQGWPAVEATRLIEVPRAVDEKPGEQQIPRFERTITAIAVHDRAIIIERRLYDRNNDALRKAGGELVDQIRFTREGDESLAKGVLNDIDYVRKNLFERKGVTEYVPIDFGFFTEVGLTRPVLAQTGVGEIAMAASANGSRVALVSNSGFASSSDFGVTYVGNNFFPSSIANQGDPALAYGGKSNAFYLGYLGRPNGGGGVGNTVNGCTVSVDRSKDGQTYAFAGHVTFCNLSATATAPLCMPDQEQMAADSVPRRRLGTIRAPKDQIYVAWRRFTLVAGAPNPPAVCSGIGAGNVAVALACSSDNGRTWPNTRTLAAAGDFPRVAVGPDGSVYVVYAVLQTDGGGTTWNQLMLDKYSSCRSGLAQQWGYPRTVVSNGRPASCGSTVPGLDRCDGQLMNSHTVTVADFLSGTVFIVYADGTVNGTDRIIVAMAPNGGFNVTGTYLLSDGAAGRKFLPWACAEGKNLYATWYDRRAATTAAPDATDFYAGWLRLDNFGPTVHRNVNLTGNADPQCGSGWPSGTTDLQTATSCPTAQPTAVIGAGAPKYGDYNANACAAGRLFAGWTSATAPSGFTGAVFGLTTFTRTMKPRVP